MWEPERPFSRAMGSAPDRETAPSASLHLGMDVTLQRRDVFSLCLHDLQGQPWRVSPQTTCPSVLATSPESFFLQATSPHLDQQKILFHTYSLCSLQK